MSLRLHCLFHYVIALAFCLAAIAAHAQSAPATGVLRGHVTDPTGALIPGAQITVKTARGAVVGTATADAAGGYLVRGLAAGTYVVEAQFPGFAPYVSAPVSLQSRQTQTFDIKMVIEAAQQQVEVTAEGNAQVSTEASDNASAVVLQGKNLQALSDDPDELSNELTALAGPSAGPNGGQIYIDGFTGGQLPPKSAIREIRVNQNPFSAEFDRLGYGRIEILTKPGTDSLHGHFMAMGNDSSFNTGNPFTNQIPPYHSIMLNGTVSGPLSKWASFFVSVENRANQDASIYTADTAILSGGTYIPGIISGGLFSPATHTAVSPRIDLQLGPKNTLGLRYQFWRNNVSGHIGQTSLPTQNATADTVENTVQIDDSQVINDRIVNETRMQYRRSFNSEVPVSAAPTVLLRNYFSSGGNAAQSSSGHNDHVELQNFTTMTAGAHAIKFGVWMRDNRQATSTSSNFNGTFNFPSLNAYLDTLNGMAAGETVAQIAAACPAGQLCTPNKLTYTTGPYAFEGNLFDAALFFQDDWKYNRFLTLSGGLRWETQNHVGDHNDFAPRVAFAYAVDGHKNSRQAKTVLRGGFGFFYDRFEIENLMNLEQYNGTAKSQTQTVITNPTCFDANNLQNALNQGCVSSGAAATSTPQIETVAPNYRSPYSEELGVSVERQLAQTSTLTVTYLHSFGAHQLVVRDSNAFLPLAGTFPPYYNATTGTRPDPNLGIVDQYYPEAVYKQNQLIVNVNAQFTRKFGVSGFYNLNNANSDGGDGSNPSNSWDLSQDYGRAYFVHPQMVFVMANYNGPWGITFNPFLVAQGGRPFSITTATDLTGDNFFNNRPAYATGSSDPTMVVQTKFGALDTAPQPGETLMPSDVVYAPAAWATNLRVSRSFGLGPSTESAGGPSQGGGGGPRGPRGFGGPFGAPRGGGGFGGGNASTGHKYSLTFTAQALNIFNAIDYGTPSGTIVPTADPTTGLYGPGPRFDVSTHLAGGMFASPSGSAARRIFFQAFFSF